jgi:hypothetical protein
MTSTREIVTQVVQHHGTHSVVVREKELIDALCEVMAQREAAVRAEGWLPIEGAPRDGTRVHLGFQYMQGFDVIAHWSDGDWSSSGDGKHAVRLHGRPKPSHFRLLPPAPVAAIPAAEGR